MYTSDYSTETGLPMSSRKNSQEKVNSVCGAMRRLKDALVKRKRYLFQGEPSRTIEGVYKLPLLKKLR